MNAQDESSIISLIATKAQGYKTMAENFARSRFLVAAMEYGQNEDESSAQEKIASGIKCRIEQTESGLSLDVDYDDNDTGNYLNIIQNGMPAPVTGGAGGFVHNPDGSTETSKVPPELWGNAIPQFAKSGSDVLGEVRNMLSQLFADEVRTIVSDSKSEIAAIAKSYILQEMQFKS